MAEAMKLAVAAGRLAYRGGPHPAEALCLGEQPGGRRHRARGGAFLMAERPDRRARARARSTPRWSDSPGNASKRIAATTTR